MSDNGNNHPGPSRERNQSSPPRRGPSTPGAASPSLERQPEIQGLAERTNMPVRAVAEELNSPEHKDRVEKYKNEMRDQYDSGEGWGGILPRNTAPDWHTRRNDNQSCPATCGGISAKDWWEEGKSKLHGGDRGMYTYRGIQPKNEGYQCTYHDRCTGSAGDANVKRVDDRSFAGTYDYVSPIEKTVDPSGNVDVEHDWLKVIGHVGADVVPYAIWGN